MNCEVIFIERHTLMIERIQCNEKVRGMYLKV